MISIYKPNKANAGCACTFQYSAKDKTVFINAILQHSWNDAERSGSFRENMKNPEKSISVKLSAFECGAIINSIESFTEASMFHTFNDSVTTIGFTPWVKKDEKGTKAFGLKIIKNKTITFKMPIEYGEAVVIREFLKNSLNKIFDTPYAPKD
jgi:hypothetical protein